MHTSVTDHEKLFDEICGKLNELSHKSESPYEDRLEKMLHQLKKSQEELRLAELELQEKINAIDSLSFTNSDLQKDMKKLGEQLEQERSNNSKLSTDLAKSLELNLKLQFEIEEIRSKATKTLNEEKKHNQYLEEKNKSFLHEIETAKAVGEEARKELQKAKEQFQFEMNQWSTEIEEHTKKQNEMMKSLSEAAEKKLIELKIALDKKTLESQDYYSHLQQALTQINVLRQENAALKDYSGKLASLHQQQMVARA